MTRIIELTQEELDRFITEAEERGWVGAYEDGYTEGYDAGFDAAYAELRGY